jgi:5-methylcytosine-specific restriction protein B
MSTFDELLIKALAAKQFLIVAGGTGTGKTRAARQVARSVAGQSRVEVVAVGADWTDNRPLLGFRNLLVEDGNIYSAPPALRMIIKAISDPSKPHFLILDEMNLSHVERYFADFLSSMESGEKIKLHDSKADLTTEDDLLIPGQLEWPKNLFVIGTVNIDETTYMFSPKVLDRAHVVEFKVSWQAISDGLNALPNAELEPMSESDVEEFMNISLDSGKKLEAEDHVKLNAALEKLFDAMNGSRFIFAHRTARDCLNYVAAAKALETSGIVPEQPIEVLIDRAILQKALPKINGSSGALTVTLNKLVAVTNELGLGLSSDKLSSMSRQLKSDQFVSFIQ